MNVVIDQNWRPPVLKEREHKSALHQCELHQVTSSQKAQNGKERKKKEQLYSGENYKHYLRQVIRVNINGDKKY